MAVERLQVEARRPNWLPLPCEPMGEKVPSVEEDDLFPKGEITQFLPRQGIGRLLSARGDAIPFDLSQIELVGPKGQPRFIKVGGRVGYDASHVSDGLKVTRMKIY